jgi:hypothetical protein
MRQRRWRLCCAVSANKRFLDFTNADMFKAREPAVDVEHQRVLEEVALVLCLADSVILVLLISNNGRRRSGELIIGGHFR